MNRFDDVVLLSGIPAPKLLEEVSFAALMARQVEDYGERWPDWDDETEYEPVRAHLGVDAYVEGLLRTRINEAASATRLATATGGDIDVIGQSRRRAVYRKTDEEDADYKARVQLSPESYSVAGPEGAYVFWSLAVEGVGDATATSPAPAEAVVTVMAAEGNGAADEALLGAVYAACSDETRRPIADRVTVQSAQIVEFALDLTLTIGSGPSAATVQAAAEEQLLAYIAARHTIGRSLPESGLHAAATVAGVERVDGVPDGGIVIEEDQVGYCTGLTITVVEG